MGHLSALYSTDIPQQRQGPPYGRAGQSRALKIKHKRKRRSDLRYAVFGGHRHTRAYYQVAS